MKLIRKGKAEQLLTKIRSVNEERDSRSLMQQGPFLSAVIRVNTLGFLSYRFFELGGVDINQGTIRRSNHVMR